MPILAAAGSGPQVVCESPTPGANKVCTGGAVVTSAVQQP